MDTKFRENIRNVAVIAHVDHGKTTLVDSMLRQSGLLGQSKEDGERVLDSNDLERERGITILAKNTSLEYNSTTINILDTPGHHDFGGEVERTLIMADGVLLLVDAAEGPLPQTRFVLKKALRLNLPVIVAINKIDRKDARCEEVLDEVYDLFIDVGADDAGIEFPVLYTDGRAGLAHNTLNDGATDLRPLFEAIVNTVPPPPDTRDQSLILQVNNLDWDNFVGRIIVGRVIQGTIRMGQEIFVKGKNNSVFSGKVMRLYSANELGRVEIKEAFSGDIISMAGVEEVTIGDTVVSDKDTPAMKRIEVDEPTLAMNFCVNTGPFAGKEGQYVTSRNLRDRLFREAMMNVAIRVEETDSTEIYRVIGRGELQMGILVETMRREGYELMLSRPEVITKEIDGKTHEPEERLRIDCNEQYMGAVTQMLGERRAKMIDMSVESGQAKLIYHIPTRGLIGLHSKFLTETRGNGVLNSSFRGWIPLQGEMPGRATGSLVSDRIGATTPYALFGLQPRGTLFVEPSTKVYEGMIIGETPNGRELNVNCTREKKLTNIRAAGKDDAILLSPPKKMSLEQAIEFIADDELIEVTPQTLRLRKRILSATQRQRANANAKY
ncbi:MAG: translational GTPase TypA [Deltaproteobacteria bacterium]|nr:translational GTPase TypA [Deltaproteobacteria bacterium]MBN2673816.1 translational GTPase TypA [Deltaproteobacteria bacterium]